MVVGWAAGGPSATAEILSLGRRPTSTPMYAGYAGPIAPRPQKMSLANSGDEEAPLEAVPAASHSPQLGMMLPANFANFGFSAPP